ncbi:Gar1/Naf1 RNA binding region-domain-containing protein, partial [Cryomyces antarcticus]
MADVDSSPDQSKKRQKPEEPQTIIAKPNVVVTPDMTIVALGDVLNIVENTVLIKAYNSGEERIIKEGSVLCLENRVVVGAVEDNIGQVREPYYSVLFNSREE